MLSVFLVDDHEIVRRGLIDLLDSDPDLRVIGEAGDVANAMAGIRATRPDVAVLDVRLPDGNGIELCRDLLAELDGLHCLILTSYTDEQATWSRTSRAWSWRRRSRPSAPGVRCWTTAPPRRSRRGCAAPRDRWPISPSRNASCWRCSARA
ncbi:LuxR family transcriptional regulator [Mycobacteroides abscessus subsp. abscessus]|nr:LuxR family transcriptional regulator [Mycobacteroides abscessus subsp. abscessus]